MQRFYSELTLTCVIFECEGKQLFKEITDINCIKAVTLESPE